MALVEGKENRPRPLTAVLRGPEVGVPGYAASGVTSPGLPAENMAARIGVRCLTRVRPGVRSGRGRAGGGAAGLYRVHSGTRGLGLPYPTSQACASVSQALVAAPNPGAWRSLCTSAVAQAASRSQVRAGPIPACPLPSPLIPSPRESVPPPQL